MKRETIDGGQEFDFGRTSERYAQYRDIYPKSMYDKLIQFGIGKPGQDILDLGSGTAILPMNLYHTGARFTATDISAEQVRVGRETAIGREMGDIRFRVCGAENTGFEDNTFDVVTAVQCFHYFETEQAVAEIHRVLRPNGLFCKIFMDWLPYRDEKIAEMERLVLKYNPRWSGGGFREYRYSYPSWAEGRFAIETIHSYDVVLDFPKEAWIERVKTCRGVGASLTDEEVRQFEAEYRQGLTDELLHLRHQIHIEIYRSQ